VCLQSSVCEILPSSRTPTKGKAAIPKCGLWFVVC